MNDLEGLLSHIHAVELATDEHRRDTDRERGVETWFRKTSPLVTGTCIRQSMQNSLIIRVSSVTIGGLTESLQLRRNDAVGLSADYADSLRGTV